MEEFALVEEGGGSLTFFDRKPADRRQPLSTYCARFRLNAPLVAVRTVYGRNEPFLVELFETVARDWQTMSDLRTWGSDEGELGLTVEHDGLGHFKIGVEMDHYDWKASGSFVVETAQLDGIVDGLRAFFGEVSTEWRA